MNEGLKAKYWIDNLDMQPHPEGGYYKEIYRNNTEVEIDGYSGKRNIATSIYYLLEKGDKSHLHRLKSDEIWYYHYGASFKIILINNTESILQEVMLGAQINKGEKLQVVIPAGTIFGGYIPGKGDYSLFGCMVNPGFHFNDFELVNKEALTGMFRQHTNIIDFLTK